MWVLLISYIIFIFALTKAIDLNEFVEWVEYVGKQNTKCPLKVCISKGINLSKPIFEMTNCEGLDDIVNYDFKVMITYQCTVKLEYVLQRSYLNQQS